MVTQLQALGAEVIEMPAIEIGPPEDLAALDQALRSLGDYDWAVLTSPNGVTQTSGRMEVLGLGSAWPAAPRLAVVGPSTAAAAVKHLGRQPDLMPAADFSGEGLAHAFETLAAPPRRVLLLVAEKARAVVPLSLRALGAIVDVVVAYRTVPPPGIEEDLPRVLGSGIDLALFASPSAVENLASAAGSLLEGLPCIVIGPTTEVAARQHGLDVRGVASPSTAEGLVAATEAALGTW